MKYRIALIVFLCFFLGLKLQAQEASNLKNSIGIASNINSDRYFYGHGPIYIFRAKPRFLLYYSRQIKQQFSLGMSVGYTKKSIHTIGNPFRTNIFDGNQQHINVEFFSRIRLFEEGDFQMFGRPVLGYNLLKREGALFHEALNVSMDLGFKYTFFNRMNVLLGKELIVFRSLLQEDRYDSITRSYPQNKITFNSLLNSFRLGFSLDF